MLAKDSPGLGSRGGWMACADCGALIDAGKWVALQLRATDALAKKYLGLLPRYAVEKQVVIAHNLFREHMRRDV